jgi:hypothetical protein
MVPSAPLFQTLGSTVKQERGWVRPGSQQPAVDRNQDWYVVQRGGHELRYRPNERLYYYGGQPRYFTTAPYEQDGNVFLALAEIAALFGGSYNYDSQYYDSQYIDPYYGGQGQPGYGYGQGQPGYEYGQGQPGYGYGRNQLRLLYPSANSYANGRNQVVVQGYAPPNMPVRLGVRQTTSFLIFSTTNMVYSGTTRTNRNGMFSVPIWVRKAGQYKVTVDLLDGYGRILDSQTNSFYVR